MSFLFETPIKALSPVERYKVKKLEMETHHAACVMLDEIRETLPPEMQRHAMNVFFIGTVTAIGRALAQWDNQESAEYMMKNVGNVLTLEHAYWAMPQKRSIH